MSDRRLTSWGTRKKSPKMNIHKAKTLLGIHDFLIARKGTLVYPVPNGYMCLCPFHHERTPSFRIYKNTRKYHCFGCGLNGTIIDMVMAFDKVSIKQALVIIQGIVERRAKLLDERSPTDNCNAKSYDELIKENNDLRLRVSELEAWQKRAQEEQLREWSEDATWLRLQAQVEATGGETEIQETEE